MGGREADGGFFNPPHKSADRKGGVIDFPAIALELGLGKNLIYAKVPAPLPKPSYALHKERPNELEFQSSKKPWDLREKTKGGVLT